METQIQIKINNHEKELIRRASKRIGLPFSVFARMVSLEKAREILKQNSEETA